MEGRKLSKTLSRKALPGEHSLAVRMSESITAADDC